MKTRSAQVDLTYNGTNVTTKMGDYQISVTYTDPASGEADSLDIEIHDRSGKWTTAWLPIAGDTLTASIRVMNWERAGDSRSLPCGFFILDDLSFSGWPVTGKISGVSVPADGAFRQTQRTQTWEGVTIREVAKVIAARAGISLVYDVSAKPFTLSSIEQNGQTDCEFLMSLCSTYGLSMKVYSSKIVIFEREEYKKKDPVGTLTESDLQSWSWNETLAGTYTGGQITYTDPITEEEITFSTGIGSRILRLSEKADGKADAERKIVAAVNAANHGSTSMTGSIMGNAKYVSGQCLTVVGIGKLSGKYYIDSITHGIGGDGYSMDLQLSLVASMTEEVMADAVARLYAVGVSDTPDYWLAHYKDIKRLDELILNMATRIKKNLGGSSIITVPDAMAVLAECGVVEDREYWLEKYTAVKWLDSLIIKAANALTEE